VYCVKPLYIDVLLCSTNVPDPVVILLQ